MLATSAWQEQSPLYCTKAVFRMLELHLQLSQAKVAAPAVERIVLS